MTEAADMEHAFIVVGDTFEAQGSAKVGCVDESSGDRPFDMRLKTLEWDIADGVKLSDGEIVLEAVKKGGAR